ncbi:MAG: hypothetical protein IPP90_15270 [Gemmatimonadaceae bacterium]|nr:hypothetical protein [Gemmatimonadaceae bacterium]
MVGMAWQAAVVADSQAVQTAVHGTAAEVVVKNPVPGFVGRAFQLAFNLPTWLQVGGAVIGAAIGLAVLVWLYRRREIGFAWLGQQSSGYKAGLAGIAGFMLLGAGGVGYAGNHYMQHDNDFCVGCHVMGDAWTAFQRSEHRKLQCHDCHRQSMLVSAKQLVSWVAEKPQDIPKHSKVPTNVCKECHAQSASDSSWKRIVATAGHRLHMNSDSSALKGVACVTCHGQEVHRFVPVDKTCGQTNCHATKDTKINLGKMAGQTSQHCTGCHTFTRVVPENISMDSTRKYLIANGSPESCFGCHEMKSKLKGFEAKNDRGHNGVCGTCHNPHKQTEPKQAYESCASSGCHVDLKKKSPFHAGNKGHASSKCGECHEPHEWKPKGRECIDCHTNMFGTKPTARPIGYRRPETGSGSARGRHPSRLQRVRHAFHAPTVPDPSRLRRVAFQQSVAATQPPAPAPPKDSPTFSHKTHKVLACAGCHDQKLAPGALKVRTKSECAACHHSAERSVTCEGCHDARTQLAKTIMRTVTMRTSANTPAKQRSLPFVHKQHRDLECKGCHTSGILLGVTRDCTSCHTEHHTADRACITCHQPAKASHQRAAHDGCAGAGCHTNATVLALPPSRSTCLTCHAEQLNHKPKRECAECHAVTWGTAAAKPR